MALERQEIESFLYREARLMDEHHYDEWEALWTDDALYWVPCGGDDTDPQHQVSHIYDDRKHIGYRTARMKSGACWAQDPPSRLCRLISNIEIQEGDNDDIVVYSKFNLSELRMHRQNTWVGKTTHKLRRENGSLKVAYKKVTLVNMDEDIGSLWFLL